MFLFFFFCFVLFFFQAEDGIRVLVRSRGLGDVYKRQVHGLRDDVVNAVVSVTDRQSFDLRDLLAKMQALQAVTSRAEFDPLIVGFKRAHRLVEKEQWDRQPVASAVFQDATESVLHKAVSEERERMGTSMQASEYGKALESLVRLLSLIHISEPTRPY